jgi:pilus assembly protein HofN
MMYQVNLLPWRRRRWRRRAILLAAMLAVELLLALGAISRLASRCREEQLTLGQHLVNLAKEERLWQSRLQVQRRQLAQRDNMLRVKRRWLRIKADNQHYERLIQQLAALLPPGLWLNSLSQREGRLQIVGCSLNYQDIVEINKRLSHSPFKVKPTWRELARLGNGVFFFRLQMRWPIWQENDAPH